MALKRTFVAGGCLVAVICALAAPWAQARSHKRKPAYTSGTYSGRVTQLYPTPAYGEIHFTVTGHSLSGVSVKVVELCGGAIWSVLQDSPKGLTVPIAPSGSFSYDKTIRDDHIQLKGRLSGNVATGTFFESLKTGALICTMVRSATFTARR